MPTLSWARTHFTGSCIWSSQLLLTKAHAALVQLVYKRDAQLQDGRPNLAHSSVSSGLWGWWLVWKFGDVGVVPLLPWCQFVDLWGIAHCMLDWALIPVCRAGQGRAAPGPWGPTLVCRPHSGLSTGPIPLAWSAGPKAWVPLIRKVHWLPFFQPDFRPTQLIASLKFFQLYNPFSVKVTVQIFAKFSFCFWQIQCHTLISLPIDNLNCNLREISKCWVFICVHHNTQFILWVRWRMKI